MFKKILKRLWYGVAIVIVLVAVSASIVRALTPWISEHRHDIELMASDMLGQPVTIQQIETDWYLLEPVIKLSQVTVFNDDRTVTVLKVDNIAIEINLLKSIWHWQLQPRGMVISGATLHIKQRDNGAYSIDGLEVSDAAASAPASNRPKSQKKILSWIFAQQTVLLKKINIVLNEKRHETLPISDMSLKLHNRGTQHQLVFSATLAQKLPTELEIIANFSGKGIDFKRYSGQFYIDAKNVLLTQWLKNYSFQHLKINNGITNVKAKGEFGNNRLIWMQSNLDLRGLNLVNEQTKQKQMLSHLATHLEWHNGAKGWIFKANKLQLNIAGSNFPENNLQVAFDRSSKTYRTYIHYLDLKYLKQFTKFWGQLPKPINDYLINLQPQGALYDSSVAFSQDKLSLIATRANKVSWRAWNTIPGITDLSFNLAWQDQKGQLNLDSDHVVITAPHYLNQAITLEQLKGSFSIDKLRVIGKQILIKNNDININTQFNFDLTNPVMDSVIHLTSTFTLTDLLKAKAYFPYKILKPKLADWLKQSILSSKPVSGTLTWQGSLSHFPYDDNSGVFIMESDIDDLNLRYHPQWPVAKHMNTHIIYKNSGLSADVKSANLTNIPVSNILINIPNIVHKPVLSIKGVVASDANQARKFILESALQKNLTLFNDLQVSGPIKTELNIDIPLDPDNNNNLVKGTIHFIDNKLLLTSWWKLSLHQLKGDLSFNQNGIIKSNLSAYLFQYPLLFNIASVADKSNAATQIAITGKIGIDAIKRIFPDVIFNFMQGEAPFKAQLSIVHSKNSSNSLAINSNLQGISIKMPPPFKKDAPEIKNISLTAKFSEEKNTALILDYAKFINANILYNKDHKGYAIKRGTIKIGGGIASLAKQDGLEVVGTIPHFSLDTWSRAFNNDTLKQDAHPDDTATILRVVDLKIKIAEILGQTYKDLLVSINRENKRWVIKLLNNNIEGQLNIPEQLNLGVRAELKRLNLNNIANNLPQKILKPQQIPPLQIDIEDFRYKDMKLGKLSLLTSNKDNDLIINQLSLTAPSYALQTNGHWILNKDGSNKSMFKGAFTTKDLAKTLQQWNIEPVIKVKHGVVNFDLYWLEPLYKFSLKKLNGSVQLKLEHGLITQLDSTTEQKIGLGKLLSVLSLQTLPRRLTLDFSDLSSKGFSFDYYKGNYTVNNGTMTTRDSNLDGSVAAVTMSGSLNLSEKQYDLHLEISPHIAASLPIVATIATGFNPVVGIATWAASKIISHEMRHVTGYSYKITGPWTHPNVEPLSITEAVKK